jgi:hypothetical protein
MKDGAGTPGPGWWVDEDGQWRPPEVASQDAASVPNAARHASSATSPVLSNQPPSKRKRRWLIGLTLLVVVLGAAIAVPIIVSQRAGGFTAQVLSVRNDGTRLLFTIRYSNSETPNAANAAHHYPARCTLEVVNASLPTSLRHSSAGYTRLGHVTLHGLSPTHSITRTSAVVTTLSAKSVAELASFQWQGVGQTTDM